MNSSIVLRASLIGALIASSARAQSDELPPQVLPWLQAPASQDRLTGDLRSMDAIRLRLALGQRAEARQEAEQFLRSYARARPIETARVILSIGTSMADERDWPEVRSWMSRSMGLIDRSAPVAERVQAHALLGHAFFALRSSASADREYEQVRALGPALVLSIESAMAGPPEEERKEWGKALTALGEAHFYEAEKARAKADAIRVPAYRGGASEHDVRRFVATDLSAWFTRRRAAVVQAEKAYLEVGRIEPAPPPHWVVAAGARVGRMWDELARAPREAPLPAAIAGDARLRAAYRAAVDGLTAEGRDRAKSAHETCLNHAVKYSHTDGFSRACEDWLVRNHPTEYARHETPGISPDHATLGVADRGLPLGRNGKPQRTPFVWERPVTVERPEERPSPGSRRTWGL